jgi:hypothetical protein
MRKTQKHRAAGRGGHPMFWGAPHDIGAIGIGKDEAHVLRHEVGWHAFWNREIKPVAMGVILPPFGVGTEIGEGRIWLFSSTERTTAWAGGST